MVFGVSLLLGDWRLGFPSSDVNDVVISKNKYRLHAPAVAVYLSGVEITSVESSTEGAPANLTRAPRRRFNALDTPRLDRLPPHSVEAEQGVIGCILVSPNDCLGEMIQQLKAGRDA